MAENILQKIVAQKRSEIARLPPGPVNLEALREGGKKRGPIRDFSGALRRNPTGTIGLIAEIKKASPSAGLIAKNFDPVAIAREYEAAGATCLSVLTDEQFFQGSLAFLSQIRNAVQLPLLRKDFIIDERQILESLRSGADAVLLIVALLTDKELRHLIRLSRDAGLSALVEVHDVFELERAVEAGPELIGINNRDLRTFQVDLGVTERLSKRLASLPGHGQILLIAESGIATRQDVERVAQAGAKAILVGESLMRSGEIKEKIRELLGREGGQGTVTKNEKQ